MKPKILIFSTAYLPLVGGAEVAIKEITDRLPDYDFEMLTSRLERRLPRVEQVGNIKVRRVGLGSFFDKYYLMFFGGRIAEKLHRNENYRLIWVVMASYGGFAALAFKEKRPDVPFVLTLQEGDNLSEIEKKVRFLSRRFKQIFTKADYIQCISSYLASWAVRMGAKAPVEVVPNGVDLSKFDRDKNSCLASRQDGEKIVATSSRLVKKNGLGDLISSLNFLQENFTLWIMGTGPEEQNLKELVKERDLEDRVKFFGFIPNDELPNYLCCADVFCRPSLSEGLGNSFLEAMALRVPVVGTPVGGIVDFIKEGETGFFCEVKNPESVAEKIRFVMDPSNNTLVKRVTVAGEGLVREKYDWEKIVERFGGILRSLLKIDT